MNENRYRKQVIAVDVRASEEDVSIHLRLPLDRHGFCV